MELLVSDAHERVREAAFGLLVALRRSLRGDELAMASGLVSVTPIVDSLAAAGWIDRDETGLVTGSAGLSLSHGPHSLTMDGATFRTWCAYDALGIPAALGARERSHRRQIVAAAAIEKRRCNLAQGTIWS